jgi:predicted Holliday junction resolvase-like endonuclease
MALLLVALLLMARLLMARLLLFLFFSLTVVRRETQRVKQDYEEQVLRMEEAHACEMNEQLATVRRSMEDKFRILMEQKDKDIDEQREGEREVSAGRTGA